MWCGEKAAGSGRGWGAHKAKGYSPARRRRAHPMGSGARRCRIPGAAGRPRRRRGAGGSSLLPPPGAGLRAVPPAPPLRLHNRAAEGREGKAREGRGGERREGRPAGGGSGCRPPRRAPGAPRAPRSPRGRPARKREPEPRQGNSHTDLSRENPGKCSS